MPACKPGKSEVVIAVPVLSYKVAKISSVGYQALGLNVRLTGWQP